MLQRKISSTARHSRAKSAKEFTPSTATWDIQTQMLTIPVTVAASGSFERLELTLVDERKVGDGTVLADAAAQSASNEGPLAGLRNPVASSMLPQIDLHVSFKKFIAKGDAADKTEGGTDVGPSQEIVLVSNEARLACEQLIHAKFARCTATFVRDDGMMEILKEVPCGSACGIRFSLQTTHEFSSGDVIQVNLAGFSIKNAPMDTQVVSVSEQPIDRLSGIRHRRRTRRRSVDMRRRSSTPRIIATVTLHLQVLTALNGSSQYLGTSASWDPLSQVNE